MSTSEQAVQKLPCKHGKSCFMRNDAAHERAFYHPDQLLPNMAAPTVKTSLAAYVSPYKSVEKRTPSGDDEFSDSDGSDDDESEVVRIAPHERAYQMRAAAAQEDQRNFAGSVASGKHGPTGPTGNARRSTNKGRGPPKAGGGGPPPAPSSKSHLPVSLGHASEGSHQYKPPPSPTSVTSTPQSTPPAFNVKNGGPPARKPHSYVPPTSTGSAYVPVMSKPNVPTTAPPPPPSDATGPPRLKPFCRECGAKFETSTDVFCGECGWKRA